MSKAPFLSGFVAADDLEFGAFGITLPQTLAGDYIIVAYRRHLGPDTLPTISDANGLTWIPILVYDDAPTLAYEAVGYWYAIAPAMIAGDVVTFGNTGYAQCARAVVVTNVSAAPDIASIQGTGTTASLTLDGTTCTRTKGSDPWSMVMLQFGGASGSIPLILAFMDTATNGSWDAAPVPFAEVFGEENTFIDVLVIAPEYGTLLSDVVRDINERSGLDASQIDVSLLNSTNVKPTDQVIGYAITHPTPASSILKPLMEAYFFDACETNGKMTYVPRGLASTLTIPEADLGLVSDKAKLEEQISQEQDLPLEVTVSYNDPTLDYQQNKAHWRRNARIISTKQQKILEAPMTMYPDWAQQTAQKALYLAWLERFGYKINLWRASYLLLDPTDVIEFIYESLTFQARTQATEIGVSLATALTAVSEFAQGLISNAIGGVALGKPPNILQLLGPTLLFLFDIGLLQDTDSNSDNTGFYFAMSSPLPSWTAGVLFESTDDANFNPDGGSAQPVTFGYATTTLSAPARSPWIWDNTNTLTVALTRGSFASDTPLNVLNGTNALLVGKELIQFTTAVQNADGSWTLSGLLRGRRGTEWACSGHATGELVVMPSTGIQRVQAPLAIVAQQRWYKGVTAGQDQSLVPAMEFTVTGADLKPYAPVHMTGTRDGGLNLTVNWIRRTRVGWRNLSQDPVPLSEDSEAYSVDILNGLTVVRTLTSTSPTVGYSAAQQTTDFGSAQASVALKVYQISAQVGRGYAGAAAV